MFENAEISPGDLPAVDSVAWQLMDAKFLRRKLTDSAIGFFFALVAVGVLHRILSTISVGQELSFGWLWIVPLLLSVPLFAWPLVSVPKKGYAVRERDIIYKSGVFWRTVTAIPFNRIQHVEKSSTPLDRRFQLASLQVFTAGGSGGDLKIHGLSTKTTEKLRFFILEKIGSSIEQE